MSLDLTASWTFAQGNAADRGDRSISVVPGGALFAKGTGTVGTSEASVDLGEVANLGYTVVENIGASGNIQVGVVTAQYHALLKPGDFCVFPADANALFVKGSIAGCLYQHSSFEAV